eukprot:gene7538-8336_t
MWARLKNFDLYRRIPKDLTESSTHSTLLSLCAAFFMLILFIAELWAFLTVHVQSNIVLDPNTDTLLRINFNLTLVDMPCEYAMIDIVDALGTRHDNVTLNINKWQVDANGLRRNYEGRNMEQPDLLHETRHDEEELRTNGQHAVPLDTNSFDMWLSRHEYTFVNFYAPWCVWCQRLHPVWEALAEKVEADHLPVSIVTVDCTTNKELCLQHKIQAFPLMKLFKHGQYQSPDFRSDRTVNALESFIRDRLSQDEQLAMMHPQEQIAHKEKLESEKNDHPGCMMAGHLMVNRVPGNFHLEMRSKHHNINPTVANLSHIVHHLSFGPVLTTTATRRLSQLPTKYFDVAHTHRLDNRFYMSEDLHQAFHHYIKVVSTTLDLGGRHSGNNTLLAYQMVASSQVMHYEEQDIPQARFAYDISPMSVQIETKGRPWYEFITSICAIIGGTFTVMGLISGLLSILFKPKKI